MHPKDHKIDTLIGRTAHLKGDFEFAGGLHLEGRISGDVRADPSSDSSLSVSEGGRIDGAVSAMNVILDGMVSGPIHARGRVVLGPHARVHGDVYYGVIEMTLGAEIMGRLVPVALGSPRATVTAAKVQVKLEAAF
ncbi:MAG TPA: polymer-forming cytoskeletal protein [Steroidobacteraceae bacterium]